MAAALNSERGGRRAGLVRAARPLVRRRDVLHVRPGLVTDAFGAGWVARTVPVAAVDARGRRADGALEPVVADVRQLHLFNNRRLVRNGN